MFLYVILITQRLSPMYLSPQQVVAEPMVVWAKEVVRLSRFLSKLEREHGMCTCSLFANEAGMDLFRS